MYLRRFVGAGGILVGALRVAGVFTSSIIFIFNFFSDFFGMLLTKS